MPDEALFVGDSFCVPAKVLALWCWLLETSPIVLLLWCNYLLCVSYDLFF